MSYGNDFTGENNPLECNLEKYCKDDVSHDFIGKQALTKIKNEGIKQKIMGIIFDGDPCPATEQPLKVLSKDYKKICLLYTSPSPRDGLLSRMPSSA